MTFVNLTITNRWLHPLRHVPGVFLPPQSLSPPAPGAGNRASPRFVSLALAVLHRAITRAARRLLLGLFPYRVRVLVHDHKLPVLPVGGVGVVLVLVKVAPVLRGHVLYVHGGVCDRHQLEAEYIVYVRFRKNIRTGVVPVPLFSFFQKGRARRGDDLLHAAYLGLAVRAIDRDLGPGIEVVVPAEVRAAALVDGLQKRVPVGRHGAQAVLVLGRKRRGVPKNKNLARGVGLQDRVEPRLVYFDVGLFFVVGNHVLVRGHKECVLDLEAVRETHFTLGAVLWEVLAHVARPGVFDFLQAHKVVVALVVPAHRVKGNGLLAPGQAYALGGGIAQKRLVLQIVGGHRVTVPAHVSAHEVAGGDDKLDIGFFHLLADGPDCRDIDCVLPTGASVTARVADDPKGKIVRPPQRADPKQKQYCQTDLLHKCRSFS